MFVAIAVAIDERVVGIFQVQPDIIKDRALSAWCDATPRGCERANALADVSRLTLRI